MHNVEIENVTAIYAADDNGSHPVLSVQPEPSPTMKGKKVGFGVDGDLERVIKSFPFEREYVAGLFYDPKKLDFHGLKHQPKEDLMQRMEDSIFEGNVARRLGQEPAFTPSNDDFSADPMDYLDEQSRKDIEVLRKLSTKEREDMSVSFEPGV